MQQDILSNLPTLHVTEIELPREFEKLYEMAYNLWWTWTPEARELFAAVDREKWGHYRNPVQLLINVDPRHWYPLLEDESFQARYRAVSEAFDAYLLREGGTFFDEHWPDFDRGRPIAYFSMEYGLHQCLAIYSGGLGVLSGDHCKSASDLGLPFVAIGLLYRRGYFQQTIDAEGRQQHIYPEYDFTRLPLRPLATRTGRDVTVAVPLPGRDLQVKLWLAQVGRVPLILLDTDIADNDPSDRPITNQLYVRGREMRLLQEIVLGIGGVRALDAVGLEPQAWHLNEGHSALLQTERLRRLVQRGRSPAEALARIRRDAVFTTHTPVPAGNEQFDSSLIRKYFGAWCDQVDIGMDELLGLGRAQPGDDAFNLTAFAIRTSSWTNGVSKLNAQVTSDMWRHLFREQGDESAQPIHPVTNGVHARTWLGPEMQDLLRRHIGPSWERELPDCGSGSQEGSANGPWDAVRKVPDRDLWQTHVAQKERLGRFVRSRLRDQYARHGASPDELRSVAATFDTRALTLGFARRFATYKRASLVFSQIERLERILSSEERPVQLLFAGKAHPADRPGQDLIQRVFEMSRSPTFRGKVITLENYDMRMGRMLVQGVDVWLNTPRRPMEASGTSGQKVAMNGGLNFSIADGWWPEGFDGRNGWVIGKDQAYDDEAKQDLDDVTSLYDTLEHEIVPLFYDRDEAGLPHRWIERMKDAMATLTASFSASRMVADYTRQAYLPASARGADS